MLEQVAKQVTELWQECADLRVENERLRAIVEPSRPLDGGALSRSSRSFSTSSSSTRARSPSARTRSRLSESSRELRFTIPPVGASTPRAEPVLPRPLSARNSHLTTRDHVTRLDRVSGSSDDPVFRSARARYGAHVMHSKHEGHEITAAAHAKGPGSLAYWRKKIDPEHELDEGERERRAEHAKKAHYARLAMLAAAKRKR